MTIINPGARVQFRHRRNRTPSGPRTLYDFDRDPRYGGGYWRGTVTSVDAGCNPVYHVLWDGATCSSVACALDINVIKPPGYIQQPHPTKEPL